MALTTFSIPLATFDPLLCHQQFFPQGPGFLETLNPQAKTGRYTLVPLRVVDSFRLTHQHLLQTRGKQQRELVGDPLRLLADILSHRAVEQPTDTPFPGGFFGFFGYDLAQQIETLPQKAQRDLPIPQLQLDWVDLTAVFDHQQRMLTLASLNKDTRLDDLKKLAENIIQHQQYPLPAGNLHIPLHPQSRITPTRFMAMVEQTRAYIAAGDIYQANLSCRFDCEIQGSSAELYRRLREINPSPFACLLQWGDFSIISSSPERLVSLRGDLAETRPLAGTRARGKDRVEDQQLATELLDHPKERAEHIMLLDLERNDLGKVCRAGSVRVDELMALERYSHVTHIVSNVCGRLEAGMTPFDLLRATFPGGTITGVPKKRCMEIIDELEPTGRGSYTGSAGYISAGGEMDLNILIRGFQRAGNHLSYQVGAGIVADSDPQREWLECLAKGEALRKVLSEVADAA
ncbi:anthranilate synthase component I family protein [Geopsychrobacter electrodiphilus]|uniref:anthranilate synthase component I family protein n=1 Tax=Geopsychrobacter electrodiphilus TaxID=225196 RepID=UPI000364A37C|nr:anthranilate synthase component I family protein [Geopsychrobacter electrodiphilus]